MKGSTKAATSSGCEVPTVADPVDADDSRKNATAR
jgi:hypothetical protein